MENSGRQIKLFIVSGILEGKREGNRRLREVIGTVQEPSGVLEKDALHLAALQRETSEANSEFRRHYRPSQFVFRAEHTLVLPQYYGYDRVHASKSLPLTLL